MGGVGGQFWGQNGEDRWLHDALFQARPSSRPAGPPAGRAYVMWRGMRRAWRWGDAEHARGVAGGAQEKRVGWLLEPGLIHIRV